eukprot:161971-Prorocentrum_lima.AAC.1
MTDSRMVSEDIDLKFDALQQVWQSRSDAIAQTLAGISAQMAQLVTTSPPVASTSGNPPGSA